MRRALALFLEIKKPGARVGSRPLLSGAPEGIRTSDLPLRRRSLYPAELQAQRYRFIIAKTGRLVNRAI